MAKVSREELLKIAQMARLKILEDEIPLMIMELEGVLSYAERIAQVVTKVSLSVPKNVNVFGADIVEKTDAAPLLAQAPEREENYFVVPKILET